jgi:diguanylate cyclase (GGDEF)-like protein/PAS domain S-box-containing protein
MSAVAALSKPNLTSLLDPIAILQRKWLAAQPAGGGLPRYEDVVLGSLGRLADDIVILKGRDFESFEILRAGRDVASWLEASARGGALNDLASDCAASLSDVLVKALVVGRPATSRIYRARGGFVETYDVLAFAMESRWGAPLVAAYVKEHGERYNLLDTIFRATDAGILALAAIRNVGGQAIDFQIVALNEGAARLLRRTQEELNRTRISKLQAALHAPDLLAQLLDAFKAGSSSHFETSLGSADNETFISVGIASIGDLVSATITDVTDLKQREASFRLLFHGNPMPMYLYEPQTLTFVDVNDAAVAHYGYERQQFLSMNLLDIRPRDEWEALNEVVHAPDLGRVSERIWRHRKADGSEIEVMIYARPVKFAARSLMLVAAVDVTEQRRAEARIAFLAHHDPLTGLANRTLFNERLGDLLQGANDGNALAVLCIDLDEFKVVNDTLGHATGDRLLIAAAMRLREILSDGELIARLGGDEFAVIASGLSGPDRVSATAEAVCEALARPFQIDGQDLLVGASIGIAMAPSDGLQADLLLRNADMALYRSKEEGRGGFHFFEPEMDRKLQAKRALENDLRKAFVNGEFELFYQPLINVVSAEASGFEALIRWRHPERGLVSPAEFIPVTEGTGLIVPLGEWILRQACADAAKWPNNLKVAVNLSPAQFKSRNLVQAVLSALAHSGLSPARLELEITESVLLNESASNLEILHQLRALGARISMDDFGTGYSSLSYLRAFPFDKIKIDQSFVRELVERSDCAAIIRAVTGLGASLGIATTAEGVETPEQLERLRAEGCTEVQGYLFSPPRPMKELGSFLTVRDSRVSSAA